MLKVKNNPPIAQQICLACLVVIYFVHINTLKAQHIGSIGGFNTISLAYKNDLVLAASKNFSQSLDFDSGWSNQQLYGKFKNNDLQVGYAVNKFMGIQAGYHSFLLFNNDSLNLCSDKACKKSYDNQHFNLAFGAFYTYDLKKTLFLKNNEQDYKLANKAHILFDVYIGYGKGFNKRNIVLESRQEQLSEWLWNSAYILRFDNYYLQPDFMFNGNFMGGGFSAFYGFIKFKNILFMSKQTFGVENFFENIIEKPTTRIYGLNFKFWAGIKQLKLVYTINRKYIIDNEILNADYSNIFNNYSNMLSLQVSLGDLF